MANEMTLFKNGNIAIPDYLVGADDMTKRLAGNTTKAISIRGGVWRMLVGGEEVAKNEDRAMNFVVVNASPTISRAYYANEYVEGNTDAPACASGDGKTPEPNVPDPQSSSCATCPQNIAGSGQNGTRACRYSQRIAVVLEGDISGTVYRLQLPAKSIFGRPEGNKMPFQAYAKYLAGHGVPITGVVSEARFDTGESVPVMRFTAVRPLTKQELDVARAQGQTEDAMQAIDTRYVPKEGKEVSPPLPAAFKAAEAEMPEPTKRKTKTPEAPVKEVAAILKDWASDDE